MRIEQGIFTQKQKQKQKQNLHKKMSLISVIFCCFKSKEEKGSVMVEAGSLSRKPKGDSQKSSAPIIVSYFPVNSHPSRL
ncbi:hypothetical protein VNO77_26024 [Canavalia gladiata]|uniref:Uncharacterized protein n=1 Tax=Canavalia gladiata TaxID=3824 RepID=A0AAN9KRN3_CANGL